MGYSLGAIVWNVDPTFFTVGPLSVRYYGLCWAVGILLGYWLLGYMGKREGVPESVIDRMALWSVVGVFIGARLGHCFVYEPAYYFSHPLEVFKVWEGGLASHGGIVGVLIGMCCVARREKLSMLWIMDHVTIPIALIATFIRIGNLMNSEIYGIETSLPWGMIFVRDGQDVPKHPTQIYEALSYFTVFLALLLVYFKWGDFKRKRGLQFSIAMVAMFTARILIEEIKNVQSPFEEGWTLNLGQIQSLPFLAVGIVLLVWASRRPPEELPRWDRNGKRILDGAPK